MFEYCLPQFCVLSFDQHLKTHSLFLHSTRHDFATGRIISTTLPLIVYSHLSAQRRQLRYVDPLVCIVRQYGSAQTHVIGRVLFQVDQKIAVRRGCRIGERLLDQYASTGVHLSGQVCELRRVSRVFEHDHVLRIQTDGAALPVFRKQILYEVDDGRVGMVALIREQVRHATVGFGHQIV